MPYLQPERGVKTALVLGRMNLVGTGSVCGYRSTFHCDGVLLMLGVGGRTTPVELGAPGVGESAGAPDAGAAGVGAAVGGAAVCANASPTPTLMINALIREIRTASSLLLKNVLMGEPIRPDPGSALLAHWRDHIYILSMNEKDVMARLGPPDEIVGRKDRMRSRGWVCSTCRAM